ncbi:transposase (fragment) [Candidatus Methylobacter favarea]|uniref:Transposase n=1 Tax=Candidatus Methylobacter favarea TaxID=2707345 RepID=A0A8S0XJ00_9GAMM
MNKLSNFEINGDVNTGKKQLDIHIRPLAIFFKVENNPQGIKEAVKKIKLHAPSRVIIESTGGFETLFVEACQKAELPIMIANPLLVRRFAAATGKLAKTDRIDAEIIAFYGEALKPRLSAVKPEQLSLMSDLLSRRRQLKEMATMEKNRPAFMMFQPFTGHTVKPLYAAIHSQRAIDNRWRNAVARGCRTLRYIQTPLVYPPLGFDRFD